MKSEKIDKKDRTIGKKKKGIPWFSILFVLMMLGVLSLPFTSLGKKAMNRLFAPPAKIVHKEVEVKVEVEGPERIVEVKIPVVTSTEAPKPQVISHFSTELTAPIKNISTFSNRSQIQLESTLKATKSEEVAIKERKNKNAYTINYSVNVKLPKPSQTLEEISLSNPNLPAILPGLDSLLKNENTKVSPYFYTLYQNKVNRLKIKKDTMHSLLTRHNFFDLHTLLNLTTENGLRITLLQGDMDVVSDGSDGDRMPTMPESITDSTHYQPFTSYFWKKTSKKPNPMRLGWQKRLKKANQELANPATSKKRKDWLKKRILKLKRGIEDMKYHSYLVAEYDPFIVIPINMLVDREDKHAPKVGDYALVIFGETIYPCIVGDGGPTFKVGEASLRIAQAINPAANSYRRPVSSLSVTYLVFPHSRKSKKTAPNYEEWKNECQKLLDQMGGLGENYKLHTWENTFPPLENASE